MELKDVILSTLAEMEENISTRVEKSEIEFEKKEKKKIETPILKTEVKIEEKVVPDDSHDKQIDNEIIFLNSMKERLLVLFEGFQAPNNTNIEAKIDLTLNFLEYILAKIDNRVESLKQGDAE